MPTSSKEPVGLIITHRSNLLEVEVMHLSTRPMRLLLIWTWPFWMRYEVPSFNCVFFRKVKCFSHWLLKMKGSVGYFSGIAYGEQPHHAFLHNQGVLHQREEITVLSRVVFEVKELRWIICVVDEFPLPPANHIHSAGSSVAIILTECIILAVWIKWFPINILWNGDPHHVADSRKDIRNGNWIMVNLRQGFTRGADDQGYSGRCFKHAAFPPKTMFTSLFTMVTGKYYGSVIL